MPPAASVDDTSEDSRASRVRTVRELLGLSQREFAKELGVAPSAVAQWETSRRDLPGPITRLLSMYEEQLQIGPPVPATPIRKPSWLHRTASTAYASALWAILRREEQANASSLERSVRSAAIDRYVQTLGELRGFGMKFGQMLSNAAVFDPLRTDDAPPPAPPLQASPMTQPEVLEVFLRETGQTPRAFFSDWSPKPIFAASIGQVHRAKLHSGEDVAVKLQYPGMVETLETDLKNVKLLDRIYCILHPAQRPGTLFDEIQKRFAEECDYRLEAENARHFGRLFEGHRDIRIPKVFDAPSSRRILTLEYVTGQSYEDLVRRASQKTRDRAGKAIWEFYIRGAQGGAFHADAHPGNLLFEDGGVTFLDYGRVGRMSDAFRDGWQELARAILERDRSRALELLERMEFTRSLDIAGEDLYRLTAATHLPWLGDGPFTFTADYVRAIFRLVRTPNLRKHFSVPREAVLWHQLLFGVYALLVPLRARVDCRDVALRYLYASGEKKPVPYSAAELAGLGLIF